MEFAAAESTLVRFAEHLPDNPLTVFAGSSLAMVQGRLAESEGHIRDAMATNESRGRLGDCLKNAIDLASLDLWFRGRVEPAVQRVEAALERYPLDSIPPAERPYLDLVWFYAGAQRPERAAVYLGDYKDSIDPELQRTRTEQSGLHAMRDDIDALTSER